MNTVLKITYHTTQDEIITIVFLTIRTILRFPNLFLPLQPLVAKHKVQLLDYVVLSALVIEQPNVNTCLWIIITLLFVKHHEQPSPIDRQRFLEKNAMRNRKH